MGVAVINVLNAGRDAQLCGLEQPVEAVLVDVEVVVYAGLGLGPLGVLASPVGRAAPVYRWPRAGRAS